MTWTDVLLQQLVTGFTNGTIIALIALGYTMVYGIVELINFAHGDLFMLGCFLALTTVGAAGVYDAGDAGVPWVVAGLLVVVPLFCGVLNVAVERFAYRALRGAPKLSPLVAAIGVSFVFMNVGLFWGGLPMEVFGGGTAAASPKDFPALVAGENLLGDSVVMVAPRDAAVVCLTLPLFAALHLFVTRTGTGRSMRAVAQNPGAAALMGVDVDKVIALTFFIGGVLGGVASVVYALYNNTIHFQMGYRVGTDAFAAAVLGGIGNLPGALVGGLVIGIIRAMSDQYVATAWTNVVVFSVLVGVLILRPSGILGVPVRDKV